MSSLYSPEASWLSWHLPLYAAVMDDFALETNGIVLARNVTVGCRIDEPTSIEDFSHFAKFQVAGGQDGKTCLCVFSFHVQYELLKVQF